MKMAFRLTLLFACISVSAIAQQKPAQQSKTKPNIIFILADDMGYGDAGCYGQKLIHTPNIDDLAKGGMLFTQFYAGSPVCSPSRSTLLTGMHTGHTPVRGNKRVPGGNWPMPDTVVLMEKVLQRAGYVTGAFGKWGLGKVGSTGDPVKRGFDEFFGYNNQTLAHNYYPNHLWENDKEVTYPNTISNEVDYSADIIQQKALEFIKQNKNKPFFLFLPYTLPHPSLQVPHDSIFENYRKQLNEQPKPVKLPWTGKGYEPQPYPETAYASMVTRLDLYVGQVMAELKSLGLEKNTLVIFTSDNGPHAEGGNDPSYFKSSGPFRGIKRDVYEGGIREPMIAYWPGHIKAGSVSDYIGAFYDFLPTFFKLADTKMNVPQRIDGISFLPALLGEKNQPEHQYLYWEFHEEGGKQAVRMGKWKAVRLQVNNHPDAPIALYNLDADPGETFNVADQNPDIVAQMKTIMDTAHVKNPVFPFFSKK